MFLTAEVVANALTGLGSFDGPYAIGSDSVELLQRRSFSALDSLGLTVSDF